MDCDLAVRSNTFKNNSAKSFAPNIFSAGQRLKLDDSNNFGDLKNGRQVSLPCKIHLDLGMITIANGFTNTDTLKD